MAKLINLVGNKFGMLAVIERGRTSDRGSPYWVCKCDCGNTTEILGSNLRSGGTKSCGCNRTACRLKHGCRKFRDGVQIQTTEYSAWVSIRDRCSNPNHKSYTDYGGRGIKVCERWLNSFNAFYEDMGPKPTPDHSIDRYPNNDGDYEPGNTRWATREQQSRNKRSNRLLTFRGETRPTTEWADILGIKAYLIAARINAGGWSVERALTEPPRTRRTASQGPEVESGPASAGP